jgi:hypothetical protein
MVLLPFFNMGDSDSTAGSNIMEIRHAIEIPIVVLIRSTPQDWRLRCGVGH